MRGLWKKAAALVIAVVLVGSMAPGAVSGATKTVKFSPSSVTLNVGKSKKVTIKNKTGSKIKKVTWKAVKGSKKVKLSKKTKKSVLVKAKKFGTAKIQALVKTTKKTYKKSFTVKIVQKQDQSAKDSNASTQKKEEPKASDTQKKEEPKNTEKTSETGEKETEKTSETGETEKPSETPEPDTSKYGKDPIEKQLSETDKMTISEWKVPVKGGERQLYGKLYQPKKEGKLPAVILSHGYNNSGNDFDNECKFYAENGYIAYAYDFCGGSAGCRSLGLKSTEMTVFTEQEDLEAALDAMRDRTNVDAGHVYLFGGSQGGFVTLQAAEARKDQVKAVAVYFPALCIPADWQGSLQDPNRFKNKDVVNWWGLNLGRCFAEAVDGFNVFEHLGQYQGPVYIIHGDQDNIAHLEDSEKAINENYKGHGELTIFEGQGHGFSPEKGREAMEKVLNFMQKNQ